MTSAFAKSSWRGVCCSPDNLCAKRRGRLVLIESLGLLRDSLGYSISIHIPEATVDCYARVEDVGPGAANLLLVGLDPRCDEEVEALPDKIRALRELCGEAPVGLVLAHDDLAFLRALGSPGWAAGVIKRDASVAITVAAIQLMWVGGFCLPPEMAWASMEAPAPRDVVAPLPLAVREPARRKEIDCSLPLTSRECDVLRILREGHQNKIIAFELGISESTVKVHLRNMMKKLHASNRTQVALGANLEA